MSFPLTVITLRRLLFSTALMAAVVGVGYAVASAADTPASNTIKNATGLTKSTVKQLTEEERRALQGNPEVKPLATQGQKGSGFVLPLLTATTEEWLHNISTGIQAIFPASAITRVIDIKAANIVNVAAPTNPSSAVTKVYLNLRVASAVEAVKNLLPPAQVTPPPVIDSFIAVNSNAFTTTYTWALSGGAPTTLTFTGADGSTLDRPFATYPTGFNVVQFGGLPSGTVTLTVSNDGGTVTATAKIAALIPPAMPAEKCPSSVPAGHALYTSDGSKCVGQFLRYNGSPSCDNMLIVPTGMALTDANSYPVKTTTSKYFPNNAQNPGNVYSQAPDCYASPTGTGSTIYYSTNSCSKPKYVGTAIDSDDGQYAKYSQDYPDEARWSSFQNGNATEVFSDGRYSVRVQKWTVISELRPSVQHTALGTDPKTGQNIMYYSWWGYDPNGKASGSPVYEYDNANKLFFQIVKDTARKIAGTVPAQGLWYINNGVCTPADAKGTVDVYKLVAGDYLIGDNYQVPWQSPDTSCPVTLVGGSYVYDYCLNGPSTYNDAWPVLGNIRKQTGTIRSLCGGGPCQIK